MGTTYKSLMDEINDRCLILVSQGEEPPSRGELDALSDFRSLLQRKWSLGEPENMAEVVPIVRRLLKDWDTGLPDGLIQEAVSESSWSDDPEEPYYELQKQFRKPEGVVSPNSNPRAVRGTGWDDYGPALSQEEVERMRAERWDYIYPRSITTFAALSEWVRQYYREGRAALEAIVREVEG